MPDATPIAAPPKRRWYQYSLRTLFIVITLIGVVLGLYVTPKVRRHNVVLAIAAAGGSVDYAASAADESWLNKQWREHVPRDWCDEITKVNLNGTHAGDATLAGLEMLSGLQVLWLAETQATDAGLAHLRSLTALRVLGLAGTQVTDAGLVHLKGLTGLQAVSLIRTQVTDAGLVHLRGLTDLRGLDLSSTQVTEAGRAELKKSLPNCDIH